LLGSNLRLVLSETNAVFAKHIELKQIEKRDKVEVRLAFKKVYRTLADGLRDKFFREYKNKQFLDFWDKRILTKENIVL